MGIMGIMGIMYHVFSSIARNSMQLCSRKSMQFT
jgi:hypothetical protein